MCTFYLNTVSDQLRAFFEVLLMRFYIFRGGAGLLFRANENSAHASEQPDWTVIIIILMTV